MRLGIIGRPGCGKTTLFRALGGERDKVPHPPGSEGAIISVDVPDARMTWLRDLEKPKKFTPARIEFFDFAGIPVKDERGKKELLAAIREVDGLVVLTRSFIDPSYPYEEGAANAVQEAQDLQQEFLLSDYSILGTRIEKLEDSVKKSSSKTRDLDIRELAILKKFNEHIEKAGGSLAKVEMSHEEEKAVSNFRFLFRKPVICVLNHAEGADTKDEVAALGKTFPLVVPLAARIEEDIASLEEADRAAFMADYGITEPARLKLIHDAYRALGLRSFFTSGQDEVRAWTIKAGDNAVIAAGKIHSDLAKGFIRGEVTAFEDLKKLGTWHEVKAQKKLRLEGKEYVVQDGDILHIRFNVA